MNSPFAGLPGHRRLMAALATAQRRCEARQRVAVLLVRIKHLAEIKSTYGFDVAELLVRTLAERVIGLLRDDDVIERIEDGCLALVLPGLSAAGQAELAAAGIVRACQQPFAAGGEPIFPRVHIGIAAFPDDGDSADRILRCADLAAAEAVDSPGAYVVYAPQMEHARTLPHGYHIERALEEAIVRDELHVCFQPKVCLRTGGLAGAEALLRWTRADGAAVAPDTFIPIAEKSNLIVPLTLWTLNTAMRTCGDLFVRDPAFSIAVNLSPVALNDPDIFPMIAQAASIWCAERSQLVLEITETALFRDPDSAFRTLHEFHGEGIRLSIDDFGTGYSSLAQLARLDLAELKIDRSFVMGLQRDARSMQIVRSVIDLAHNFGMTVVAEGIEDAATFDCLTELGCDHGQGYYIARPMRAEAFLDWADEALAVTPGA